MAASDLADDDPASAARTAVVRTKARARSNQPRAVWDAARVPVVMTILAGRLEELANKLAVEPPVHLALDHCAFADFSKGAPDDLAELAEFPNLSLKVSTIARDMMAKHGGVADLAAVFAPTE